MEKRDDCKTDGEAQASHANGVVDCRSPWIWTDSALALWKRLTRERESGEKGIEEPSDDEMLLDEVNSMP